MSWSGIFRSLSAMYGWTPDQIADLTLKQIAMVLNREDNTTADGLLKCNSLEEATAYRAMRQQQIAAMME